MKLRLLLPERVLLQGLQRLQQRVLRPGLRRELVQQGRLLPELLRGRLLQGQRILLRP